MTTNRLIPIILAIAAVLVVLLLIVVGTKPAAKKKATSPPVRQAAVEITATGFVPSSLSVKKGTKVTWKNDDKVEHRVKANPYPEGTDLPGLDSKVNLPAAATYSYTFLSNGTFNYHDQLHPLFNGTVKVTP